MSHSHAPYPARVNTSYQKYKNDQRIRIDLPNAQLHTPGISKPYKWICRLEMISYKPGDKPIHGTGFLINIPGSTRCTLLTAAHNLFDTDTRKYITSVTVTFPGYNPVSITGEANFKVPHGYISERNIFDDYAIIILPDSDRKSQAECCGFGFSAVFLDRELLETNLSCFGFTGNEGDMWGSGGRTQSVDRKMVRYLLQTSGGQSGSPVFTWYRGFWTVVGIHVRYEQRSEWIINSAIRLNTEVIAFIALATKHPYQTISLHFQDKYLSMDETVEDIPGVYGKLRVKEQLDESTAASLLPVQSYPEGSSMPASSNTWVIVNAKFPEKYESVCIDTYTIPKSRTIGDNPIGLCLHLGSSPILRRSCELVSLWEDEEDPSKRYWVVKSVRYPLLDLKVKIEKAAKDPEELLTHTPTTLVAANTEGETDSGGQSAA